MNGAAKHFLQPQKAGLWTSSSDALCCCRPRVYLRAQSARPQVGIDAQGDQPRPASSPAITLSATSLVDGLPASASVS